MNDLEICQRIAGEVEDGTMPGALMALLSHQEGTATDGQERRSERPRLTVDLSGEDGNAFFLVARCIHALMRAGREQSACTVLASYAQQGKYPATVAYLRRFVDF